MHIKRIFTLARNGTQGGSEGPYDSLTFRRIGVGMPDGASMRISAPSSWPVGAVEAFAAHGLLRDKVPSALRQVRERGCPKVLRRHVPLNQTSHTGCESDIRTALDRVAGGLARAGWDNGYFDRESDALAFQDELRACLVQQRATLSAQCWQTIGVAWAYGADLGLDGAVEARATPPYAPASSAGIAARAKQLDDASALALGRAMLGTLRTEIEAAVHAGGADAATNPLLRPVLDTARQYGLPATSARRLIDLCAAGLGDAPQKDAHLDFDSDVWDALGTPPNTPAKVSLDARQTRVMDAVAAASYGGSAPVVVFDHTLTAVTGIVSHADHQPAATINAAACMRGAGEAGLDIDATIHVVRLMTIALDIARGEHGGDAERSVTLNIANVAPVVMSHGMPYGLDEGRGLAATFAALVTATALATSADMAAHMCAAPNLGPGQDDAGRFMRNMQRALLGQGAGYEGLSHAPQPLYPFTAQQAELLDAARAILSKAMERLEQTGLRNLVLTGAGDDAAASGLLAAEAPGFAPMKTLVQYRRLTPDFDDTAIYKVISPAVPRALRALQHDDAQIDQLIDYVVGHGSLADAPGINHDLLRERGFCDEDIEATESLLATAATIRGVFTPYVLGWDDVFEEDDDVLSRLGFSEWDVEHANFHCCGALTLEGARGLPLEHLPVFDCDEPLGRIGTRHVSIDERMKMALAVQPFVSGEVMLDLELPQDITVDEIGALYRRAGDGGLRAVRFNRAGTDLSEPLSYDELTGGYDIDGQRGDGHTGDGPARGGISHANALEEKIQVRTVERDLPDVAASSTIDLATAISIGLEHGVPLDAYAAAFGGDAAATPDAFAQAMQAIAAGYLGTAPHQSPDFDPLHETHLPAQPRKAGHVTGAVSPHSPRSRTGIRRKNATPHAPQASGATALSPPSVSGRHREE